MCVCVFPSFSSIFLHVPRCFCKKKQGLEGQGKFCIEVRHLFSEDTHMASAGCTQSQEQNNNGLLAFQILEMSLIFE